MYTWTQLSLLINHWIFWYSVSKLSHRLRVTHHPATVSGAVMEVHRGIRCVAVMLNYWITAMAEKQTDAVLGEYCSSYICLCVCVWEEVNTVTGIMTEQTMYKTTMLVKKNVTVSWPGAKLHNLRQMYCFIQKLMIMLSCLFVRLSCGLNKYSSLPLRWTSSDQ